MKKYRDCNSSKETCVGHSNSFVVRNTPFLAATSHMASAFYNQLRIDLFHNSLKNYLTSKKRYFLS